MKEPPSGDCFAPARQRPTFPRGAAASVFFGLSGFGCAEQRQACSGGCTLRAGPCGGHPYDRRKIGMLCIGKAPCKLRVPLCARPHGSPQDVERNQKRPGFFVVSSDLSGLCTRRDCGIMKDQKTKFAEAMGSHRVISSTGMAGFSPAEDCHEYQGPAPVPN